MASNIVNSLVSSAESTVFAALTALAPSQALVTANVPAVGIAGFLFDIPDEDKVELSSDITDYHIEDNTAVQDNIALRPIRITLRGFVAELVQTADQSSQLLASSPDALPLNLPMVPGLSPQAQDIQDAVTTAVSNTTSAVQSQAQNLFQLVQAVTPIPQGVGSIAQAAINLLGGGGASGTSGSSGTKQASAFNFFFQLWQARSITISAETPWGTFNNMAIENVVATQSRDSKFVTDFTVTLKQIRTATTTVVSGQLAGRAIGQSAESNPTPNGAIGTVDLTTQQTGQIFQGMTYTLPTI